MALLLVVLLGVVGFVVDLGWIYWNRIEIQHGADAAALSGVVYASDNPDKAKETGRDVAAINGYIDTTIGGSDIVEIIAYQDDPSAVAHEGQLRATITHEVPTFFMRVFGINSLNIARTAVAEYVLPLPMGSPEPYFGNDPALGRWPNFWGNIHGYYTGKGMGDRYSSQCIKWEKKSGCTKNDERRQSVNAGSQEAAGGYLYGIEIDSASVGSILTVELFDPQFTRGGGDHVLVGDNPQGGGDDDDDDDDDDSGPTTTFMLYGPDPTPLVTTDGNALVCSVTYDPRDPYADFNGDGKVSKKDDQDGDGDLDWDDVELGYPGGVAALWEPFCTIPINEAGIFPLRIIVSDPGGADQRGLNRWSMRAFTSGGPAPRVYGLGTMSIYANVDGTAGPTVFHLAEVLEIHAGKTLVIEMFDPGDAAANHSVEIQDSSGTAPPCEWVAVEDETGATTSGSETSCIIATTGGAFNNWLVTIKISLPTDYVCAADCWWKVVYNYPGITRDSTTWSARIEGRPVHLTE
ncbi:MAG: hypothetical protein IIA44_01510 [Acidobacteria bacterium]|nr:hypothetical protein [Acidobacteriota bacterium]